MAGLSEAAAVEALGRPSLTDPAGLPGILLAGVEPHNLYLISECPGQTLAYTSFWLSGNISSSKV